MSDFSPATGSSIPSLAAFLRDELAVYLDGLGHEAERYTTDDGRLALEVVQSNGSCVDVVCTELGLLVDLDWRVLRLDGFDTTDVCDAYGQHVAELTAAL